MGYPAQISGAEDDPVMQAIRAKFAQQQQAPATGMPTNILPEQMRMAAQRAVLAQNSNAKPVALNSQMQAMHNDPAIMQQIMSQYGPDMAAQYGGGNGTVQQPQAIQQPVSAAPMQANAQAAQGLPPSYAEEVAPENAASAQGPVPTAPAPSVDASGMDPALAAALGITGGAAAGAGAGYVMGRRKQSPVSNDNAIRQQSMDMMDEHFASMELPKAPIQQVLPDDFGAHDIDQSVMKAITPDQVDNPAFRAASKPVVEAPIVPPVQAAPAVDPEEGIPSHMRSDVATPPVTKNTQRLAKDADMNDQHMRSIIMEGQQSAPVEQPVAQTQAAPEGQVAASPTKKTRKKKADAPKAEGEAPSEPKKRGRKAKAEPNAEGGTDYVHTDATAARAAIKKSKAKVPDAFQVDGTKLNPYTPPSMEPFDKLQGAFKDKETTTNALVKLKKAAAEKKKEKSLVDKVDTVAADSAPKAEAPAKKTRKKSKLDVDTSPGAPASVGMSLSEAKSIVSENPTDAVLDKFYTDSPEEWDAYRKQASELIKASKRANLSPAEAAARLLAKRVK